MTNCERLNFIVITISASITLHELQTPLSSRNWQLTIFYICL